MQIDATTLLAQRRAVELSAKAVTFLTSKGEDVLVAVLAHAREKAEAALVALCNVNAEDAVAIRHLQNEVRLYTDLIEHISAIVRDGAEIDATLREMVREETAELVIDDEDALALGLSERQRAPTQ